MGMFAWKKGSKKELNEERGFHNIRREIMSKVPRLLEKGGYFPNGDHGIQPLELCRI